MFLNGDDFLNLQIDRDSLRLIDHYIHQLDETKTTKKKPQKTKDSILENQKKLLLKKTFNLQNRTQTSQASRNKLSQSVDENNTAFYKDNQDKMQLFNIAEEKALTSEVSDDGYYLQNHNRNHQAQNIQFRKKWRRPDSKQQQERYQVNPQDQIIQQSQQNVENDLRKLNNYITTHSINTSQLLNQTINISNQQQRRFPQIKRVSDQDAAKDIPSTATSSNPNRGIKFLNNIPNINPYQLSPKSEKIYGIYTNQSSVFTMKTLSTNPDVKQIPTKKQSQSAQQSPVKVQSDRIQHSSVTRQRYSSLNDTIPASNYQNIEKPKFRLKERCKSSQNMTFQLYFFQNSNYSPIQNDEDTLKRKKINPQKCPVQKQVDISYDKQRVINNLWYINKYYHL